MSSHFCYYSYHLYKNKKNNKNAAFLLIYQQNEWSHMIACAPEAFLHPGRNKLSGVLLLARADFDRLFNTKDVSINNLVHCWAFTSILLPLPYVPVMRVLIRIKIPVMVGLAFRECITRKPLIASQPEGHIPLHSCTAVYLSNAKNYNNQAKNVLDKNR